MKRNEFKQYLVEYKLLYTLIIVMAYLVGRLVPLYGVDTSVFTGNNGDSESIMMQAIGGDINKCSVFALGISPYMVASIFSSTAIALRKASSKSVVSPVTINRITVAITFLIALFQALLRAAELPFIYDGIWGTVSFAIAVLEMVIGAILILWLSERNKRFGFGGQTALIFVNIVISITSIVDGKEPIDLLIPIIVSLVVMRVVIRMEYAEKRIPVQRMSIHNIYADKNYLAIKLNPIGIMPVMFATAFFTIPQMITGALYRIFPESETVLGWKENMTLQSTMGICWFLGILFFLTVFFSFIFINPKDITEQFLKSGDSIVNVHAGDDTRKYLMHSLLHLSSVCGLVLCVCMGAPLFLSVGGAVDSELAMLPSTAMILTGIWCTLSQEKEAVKKLDSYKPFI